jgi:hypothetical protein
MSIPVSSGGRADATGTEELYRAGRQTRLAPAAVRWRKN